MAKKADLQSASALCTALKRAKKLRGSLQDLDRYRTELSTEIEKFDGKVSPEALGRKQVELSSIPSVRKRIEEDMGEATSQLFDHCERLERELLAKAEMEVAAGRSELIALLESRGFCRDSETAERAVNLAAPCFIFASMPDDSVGQNDLPSDRCRDNDPAKFDASVLAKAEELLEVADGWKAAGGLFAPILENNQSD